MNPFGLYSDDIRPFPNVIWNLFLAAIPMAIAFWLVRSMKAGSEQSRPLPVPLIVIAVAVWCAFLPNTCYLITEWRHYIAAVQGIDLERIAPHIDAVHEVLRAVIITGFYVCYSGAGLLGFFLAVWPLEHALEKCIGRKVLWLRLVLIALCTFGVFLGLVYRFNTWDLINPSSVHVMIRVVRQALANPLVDLLLTVFTALLWFVYEAFQVFMVGLKVRSGGES